MTIQVFEGETFLAFLDISGFKEMMRTGDRAWLALDKFYSSAYDELKKPLVLNKVEGLFISASGILFVRDRHQSHEEQLGELLSVIKNVNRTMLASDCMLTTSISYGPFKYQQRIEFEGIEKNTVFGNAYVAAFLDQEVGLLKIQPGQCRIIKEGLPPELDIQLGFEHEVLKAKRSDNRHYYYYWSLANQDEIEPFEKKYGDSYNLKYQGMLKTLKESTNIAFG